LAEGAEALASCAPRERSERRAAAAPRRAESYKSFIEIGRRDLVEPRKWDKTGKEVLVLGLGASRRHNGLLPEWQVTSALGMYKSRFVFSVMTEGDVV
jgi:hypothetical protein